MLSFDQIQKRLKPMNLKAVAEDSGVSYFVLRKIAAGNKNVFYWSVENISNYLTQQTGK